MPKEYVIREVKDFLNIPENKLDACLEEFKQAILLAKNTQLLLHTIAENIPAIKNTTNNSRKTRRTSNTISFHTFVWIDDKNKIANVRIAGTTIWRLRAKPTD